MLGGYGFDELESPADKGLRAHPTDSPRLDHAELLEEQNNLKYLKFNLAIPRSFNLLRLHPLLLTSVKARVFKS
jgi:hypothetical protein